MSDSTDAATDLIAAVPEAAGPSPHVYADWKAPQEDAATLIWPEPRELLHQTLANQRLLSSATSVRVQNVPLSELRTSARRFIGHPDQQPLIANGHQTELHHAGVWAKNVLMHVAAPKIDAAALHV